MNGWSRLKHRVHWRLDVRTIVRALFLASVALYLAVAGASLARAWTSDGSTLDRQQELKRLEHQLAEAKARTERFRSQIAAIDTDAEVRMGIVRRELGMLRPDENFVVFK